MIGWVPSTDIGEGITPWMNKYAPNVQKTTPEASAIGVVKVMENITLEDAASFKSFDGASIPW